MTLLDLYCGAGGASVGYKRAGFEIVGIDITPQKNYPFEFIQADAFEYLNAIDLSRFDAIHASPPCQRYSYGTPQKSKHPNLVGPTRELIEASGLPWVMENVPGSPLRSDIIICGCMVGLPLIRRRRLFETSWYEFFLLPTCQHLGPVITVTGHGTPSGNRKTWGRNISIEEKRNAMGIKWMNRNELSQAIPPNYTELIGISLMNHLLKKVA